MRQSLITVGFFVGILSLPVAVAACGDSLTKAHPAGIVQGPSENNITVVAPEPALTSIAITAE